METKAGVELTKEQIKLVKQFQGLMKKWDKNLCLNAMAGVLHITLLGDTKQNKEPEYTDRGGLNPDNCIVDFSTYRNVLSDGGDW